MFAALLVPVGRDLEIDNLAVRARRDGEPALRVLGPHQLAIMLEDDLKEKWSGR